MTTCVTTLQKHNRPGICTGSGNEDYLRAERRLGRDQDLVMEIEQEFDIDVPINMLSDVDTIEDVVELVGSRVKGR